MSRSEGISKSWNRPKGMSSVRHGGGGGTVGGTMGGVGGGTGGGRRGGGKEGGMVEEEQ